METLRVSSKSRPNSVAGAIAALLRTKGEVEVQAIGPQAVNQAVKAIAIARGYIAPDNLDLVVKPAFVKLELENEERTALKFSIKAHPWKLEGRDASEALAVAVLLEVDRGGRAQLLLDRALRRSPWPERDRAYATFLVYGALRRLRLLDHLLAPSCPGPRACPRGALDPPPGGPGVA